MSADGQTVPGRAGKGPNGQTYIFPDVPGETPQQIQRKIESGYTELPSFDASDSSYCCQSCEYFTKQTLSATGFQCAKYDYWDRPNGCCDGWEARPDLRRYTVAQD